MTTYVIGAVVLAIIGAAVWLYVAGRRSGRDSQRNRDLERIDDVQDKQLEAANQRRDPAAVAERLRRHDY